MLSAAWTKLERPAIANTVFLAEAEVSTNQVQADEIDEVFRHALAPCQLLATRPERPESRAKASAWPM